MSTWGQCASSWRDLPLGGNGERVVDRKESVGNVQAPYKVLQYIFKNNTYIVGSLYKDSYIRHFER